MQLWEQSQKGDKEPFLFWSVVSLMLFKQLGVCSLSQTCSWLKSVWVFEEKILASFQCLTWCCSENVCYILSAFHSGWVFGKSGLSIGSSFVLVFHSGIDESKSERNNLGCSPPCPYLAVPVKYENCFRWKGRNICLYEKSFLSSYKV